MTAPALVALAHGSRDPRSAATILSASFFCSCGLLGAFAASGQRAIT